MGHPACQGFDGTGGEASAVVMDALATPAILLVGDHQCGVVCCQQLRSWCCWWNDGLIVPAQDDILDAEALGAGSALGRGVGAFANSQQKIEGDAGEITQCLVFGVAALEAGQNNVMGDGNGHRQFALGKRVLAAIKFHLLAQGGPLGGAGLVLAGWAGAVVQVEGLADGCQHLLNSLSANLIFSSCVATSNPMGKGLHEGKLVGLGQATKEWVGEAEVEVEEAGPVSPELVPFLVGQRHDPMGCGCSRTSDASLVVRWCKCQEAFCERGNLELNIVRSSRSVSSKLPLPPLRKDLLARSAM